MRVFVDETGAEWVVWEVRPGKALFGRMERRVGSDRRVAAASDPVIERRQVLERRVRRRGVEGAQGAPGSHGWLAFQSGTTRRRLVPIPPGWREGGGAPAPPGTPIG